MPVNNEDALTCKQKIWGKNWLYLKPYFKAFHLFSMFLKLSGYIYWQLIAGSSNLYNNLLSGFFEKCEICRHAPNYIYMCKNCNKRSWMILLTRDRLEQFSSLFVLSFQWNQTTMRWSSVSQAYHFLKKLANCVDSMLISLFLWCLKLRFKIFRKRYHSIFSHFAIIEAVMSGTNSLKRFLKKKLVVQRNTKILRWI